MSIISCYILVDTMKEYTYQVLRSSGELQTGQIRAENELDAISKLQAKKYIILKLREKSFWWSLKRPMGYERLRIEFCQQIGIMVQAGVPILESIQTLSANKDFASAGMGAVVDFLQEGYSLGQAMKHSGAFFSNYMIAMVMAGEMAGKLGESFEKMQIILRRSYDNKEKMRLAMLYPMLLFIMSVLLVIFLLHQVIPSFMVIFASFQTELPWSTKVLVHCSEWVRNNLVVCLTLCLGGGLAGGMCYRQKNIARLVDKIFLRVPVIGKLYHYQDQALFLQTMAMLLGSGIVVNQAVDMASSLCSNKYLMICHKTVAYQVSLGHSLSVSMQLGKGYSELIMTMIRAGEKSGELAAMLGYAGDFCQQEAQRIAQRIQILAEPVMLLLIGSGVGFVVVSTILPILDMMTLLGGG